MPEVQEFTRERNNLRPIPMECDAPFLKVTGELPREFNGILYRNGPNPQFDSPGSHWFVGDGMLHASPLENGRPEQTPARMRTEHAELEHQALHDPLTKLANRVLFNDRVRHALGRRVEPGQTVAVMYIDLDDFKTVNDSLGHAAGDALLIQVAERMSVCVRPDDTVARLGGDEFAIIM